MVEENASDPEKQPADNPVPQVDVNPQDDQVPHRNPDEFASEIDDLLEMAMGGCGSGQVTLLDDDREEPQLEFEIVRGEIDYNWRLLSIDLERKFEAPPVLRKLRSFLEGHYKGLVEPKLATSEVLCSSEAIMSLPNPTAYRPFKLGEYSGFLEMNPSIFLPLLHKLGPNGEITDESPLKEDENRAKWTEMSSEMLKVFAEAVGIETVEEDVDSNPLFFDGDPRESVVLACYEVTAGENHGLINFVVPLYPLATRSLPFENSPEGQDNQRVSDVIFPGLDPKALKRLRGQRVNIEVDLGKAVRELDKKGPFYLERDPNFVDVYANGMFLGTGFLDEASGVYTVTLLDIGDKYSHTEHRLKAERPLAVDVSLKTSLGFADFYKMGKGSKVDVGKVDEGVHVSIHRQHVGMSLLFKEYPLHVVKIEL